MFNKKNIKCIISTFYHIIPSLLLWNQYKHIPMKTVLYNHLAYQQYDSCTKEDSSSICQDSTNYWNLWFYSFDVCAWWHRLEKLETQFRKKWEEKRQGMFYKEIIPKLWKLTWYDFKTKCCQIKQPVWIWGHGKKWRQPWQTMGARKWAGSGY